MSDSNDDSQWAGTFVGCIGPVAVAGLLVGVRGRISVADVALALVLTVVLAAHVGGRRGGGIAAVVAALSLDFFHTRPYLSLNIGSSEDVITVGLLLTVGIVVGGLSIGRRTAAATALSNRHEVVRLHRVAELVASGADTENVRFTVEAEVTATLGLAACTYEGVPAGGSGLPRLEGTGKVSGAGHRNIAENGQPELPQQGVELAVIGRGAELGRFVCTPTRGFGVALEQRLAAIALADQLGAVLVSTTR